MPTWHLHCFWESELWLPCLPGNTLTVKPSYLVPSQCLTFFELPKVKPRTWHRQMSGKPWVNGLGYVTLPRITQEKVNAASVTIEVGTHDNQKQGQQGTLEN